MGKGKRWIVVFGFAPVLRFQTWGIKKIHSSAEVMQNISGKVHKSNVDPENKYYLTSGLWWGGKKIIFSTQFLHRNVP